MKSCNIELFRSTHKYMHRQNTTELESKDDAKRNCCRRNEKNCKAAAQFVEILHLCLWFRAFILCTRNLSSGVRESRVHALAMVMSLFYYYFIVILLCTEIHFVCFGDGFFPRRMACIFALACLLLSLISTCNFGLLSLFLRDTGGRDSKCYCYCFSTFFRCTQNKITIYIEKLCFVLGWIERIWTVKNFHKKQ